MNTAIILSGGIGTRMGADRPKQYIEVNGTPIIAYCLKAFLSTARIDAFIIGAAEEWRDYINSFIQKENATTPFYYSEPGETRQYSIYNALKKAKEIGIRNKDVVIIHDAARPLVSKELIERKNYALTQYAELTMRSRQSSIERRLKAFGDSLLTSPKDPPFIIHVKSE